MWRLHNPTTAEATREQAPAIGPAPPPRKFPIRPPPSQPVSPRLATGLGALLLFLCLIAISLVVAHPLASALVCSAELAFSVLFSLAIWLAIHHRRMARHVVAEQQWLKLYLCNGCGDLGFEDGFATPADVTQAAPLSAEPATRRSASWAWRDKKRLRTYSEA